MRFLGIVICFLFVGSAAAQTPQQLFERAKRENMIDVPVGQQHNIGNKIVLFKYICGVLGRSTAIDHKFCAIFFKQIIVGIKKIGCKLNDIHILVISITSFNRSSREMMELRCCTSRTSNDIDISA